MSSPTGPLTPRWYSPAEVAVLLGFGLSKVKMKIATGELRSIKDGKYRRILPEWVDQYVQDQIDRQEVA
jgi:excisionase family DNA binding protein